MQTANEQRRRHPSDFPMACSNEFHKLIGDQQLKQRKVNSGSAGSTGVSPVLTGRRPGLNFHNE